MKKILIRIVLVVVVLVIAAVVAIGLSLNGAIKKGVEDAKKHVFLVPLVKRTIPHPIVADFGAAKVLLRPASAGTGVIAGGSVRAVVESAGIHDILSKSLGSTNPVNVVMATIRALGELRSADTIAETRGFARRAQKPAEVAV